MTEENNEEEVIDTEIDLRPPLYDGVERKTWIAELEKHRFHNRQHLYALWAYWGTPQTMLDIGCGIGDLVHISRKIGIEAYGVDQLVGEEHDPGWFFHEDLREPFSLTSSIDKAPSIVNLVLCWEVAEHIPEESIGIFMDTLASHVKRDAESALIFTSAHPGQGGTEHNTVRPATFWRDEFHLRGLNYEPNYSTKLALLWSTIETPLYWLPANVQVFKK